MGGEGRGGEGGEGECPTAGQSLQAAVLSSPSSWLANLFGDDEGYDASIVDNLPLQLHFLLEGEGGIDLHRDLTVGEH